LCDCLFDCLIVCSFVRLFVCLVYLQHGNERTSKGTDASVLAFDCCTIVTQFSLY
jgi:hypothetical protein